jgi:hypothetical protein
MLNYVPIKHKKMMLIQNTGHTGSCIIKDFNFATKRINIQSCRIVSCFRKKNVYSISVKKHYRLSIKSADDF